MQISNNIKKIAAQKKFSLKEIAELIGMSETGFLKALKTDDFKISVLENIAKVLEIPITYFFENNTNGIIQKGKYNMNGTNHGNIKISEQSHEIDLLKKEIEGLHKQIELLNKVIEVYEKN